MAKMNSKDSKAMDKLKQFFRMNKGGAHFKPREDYLLPPEIEREIRPEFSISHRMKVLKDLGDIVLKYRMEESAVGRIWNCTKDLLQDIVAKEHRHQAFQFFRFLIQGQFERLGMMRTHFFMVVKNHKNSEDTLDRLELLSSLTDNGKDIVNIENELPPFLLEWMPEITMAGIDLEFLNMLLNVIKYNAAYIDEIIIIGLVTNICMLACQSPNQAVVLACLQVLDTVVCYSNLPSESLPTFIGALCRTVNLEVYCATSWKIMRNLLGTHLGHSSLYSMCHILQSTDSNSDVNMLRGAVFYINMSLWGEKRVTNLKCTYTSILPSFNLALKCDHPLVLYEVMLSIQRLVNKYGLQLHDPTWDLVLNIIDTIVHKIEPNPQNTRTTLVANHLHETLYTIEQLIELGQFNGSVRKVFQIIENCSHVRPEASVLKLVTYLSGSIVPTQQLWLTKLSSLMERYFKQEKRTTIRVKVLDILSTVIQNNRSIYEEELVERIVLPHLENIDLEPDISVRNSAAMLLVDLCLESETKKCIELLDILERLLVRGFEQHEPNSPGLTESDALDVKTVVHGVIKIFTTGLFTLPSIHAVKAHKMLVRYLELHYEKTSIYSQVTSIRSMIFECFLRMKVDSLFRLGVLLKNGVKYSPYVVVEHRYTPPSPPPAPSSPAPGSYPVTEITYLSLSAACRTVVACLKQELDWKVLLFVLQEITQVVKNKALILARYDNVIDQLATALCSMVSDKSLCLPDILRNIPPKFTRSDFQGYIFPVLASLASCHAQLEPSLQQRLIKCLECGLASRSVSQCVTALTICTLEMRDAMVKLLPEVLLNLSKISATVLIAIPILEFLSTLTRLPKVFANFVGDQFMSVFAISLPYTNPFKYNHYTVSLAHHVIAVWFLKCRLTFRRDLVKYIITGLKANVLVPFEEGQIMKQEIVNEDSSNRKRSSSLTEQTSRRRERPLGRLENRNLSGATDLKPPIDTGLMGFHRELTETCMDLMARYTFSTCAALPKRQPTAQFLLNEGQSMTWLLGNKLITVTTSGCSQKPLKNGLCDKCWQMCRLDKDPISPSIDPNDPEGKARTSKLTLTRSFSNEITSHPHTSNSSTAASSPSEEVKRTVDSTIQDADPLRLDHLMFGNDRVERQQCACWCQAWAEIYVRRPTGDMSWVMRIQNEPQATQSTNQPPMSDISTLFLPSLHSHKPSNSDVAINDAEGDNHGINTSGMDRPTSDPVSIPCSPIKRSPSRHNSKDSVDNMEEDDRNDEDGSSGKSRNPVRRSNSSPEMSASWKNPFMSQNLGSKDEIAGINNESGISNNALNTNEAKKKQTYSSKDLRVNCEAIPEEMGTTPPMAEQLLMSQPSLLLIHQDHRKMSAPAAMQDNQILKQADTTNGKQVDGLDTKNSISDKSFYSNKGSTEQNSLSMDNIKTIIKDRVVRTDSGPKDEEKSNSGPPSVNQSPVSLTNPKNAALLTTKPPLSPPPSQLSPRLQPKLKEAEFKPDPSTLPPLIFKRDRVHTISVMSPVRKPREWDSIPNKVRPTRAKEAPKSGVSPSFVFLQLYHSSHFGHIPEKPLVLSNSQVVQRALKNLDRIPPYETHKVGVIYVGPGQANSETDILRNQYGSLRYAEFLQRLGTLIKLSDADPQSVFLGGLDRNGNDGKYAYIWQDDVIQVTFHVATLMPPKETDPNCNDKKLHIGNDYVTIVYNDSGEQYNIRTVKCQFNYACVVVEPLEHGSSQVVIKAREELIENIGHSEPKIVSDQNVALLARQLALHANLASMVSCSLNAEGKDPYTSNWLERLRQIKRVRNKVLQEANSENSDTLRYNTQRRLPMDDFTEYT